MIYLIDTERVKRNQGQDEQKHTDPKLWKKISVMGLSNRKDEFPMTKREDGGRCAQESTWDGLYDF